MTELNRPLLDAPISGQHMTSELGGRPWQQAPQYATVDEAIEYYLDRMSSDEFTDQVVDVLEMDVPVTTLANTIQLGGVMDGKHTVDVGMLVLPMLMEMIMMVGDSAGIDYDSGMTDKSKPRTRDTFIAKVISDYEKEIEDVDLTDDTPDVEEKEVMEEPKGLMARRT